MTQVSKSGLVWLSLALVGLYAVDLLTGSVQIPFRYVVGALVGETNTYAEIIWQFRLPKALTCVLAGSALSVSGLMMQTLFRNPLAGPDVLGLTSGSSLFVAALILTGQLFPSFFVLSNPWIIAIAASSGAALVFVIIIAISRFVNDNTSLLIIGLMIGAATSSIVGVLQFISKAEDLQAFMIWGLGNVGGTGWDEIGVLTVVVIAGLSLSFLLMKPLNGFLLGEQYAQSLGIPVRRSRMLILTATCMMTGGVTAFCGPIAFVGLAVPHLVRLLQPTTNHKIMIPAVMLGGASLLLVCDIIAQLPGSTQILPINAVTSLIGAPVVIWLIIRNKKVTL